MFSESMVWRASCTEQTVSWQKNITRLQNLSCYKFKETCDFSLAPFIKGNWEVYQAKTLLLLFLRSANI